MHSRAWHSPVSPMTLIHHAVRTSAPTRRARSSLFPSLCPWVRFRAGIRHFEYNTLDGSLPPEYSTMTKLIYLCVAYTQSPSPER